MNNRSRARSFASLSEEQSEALEALCSDFEKAWARDGRPNIAAFLGRWPHASGRGELLENLLRIELNARRVRGERPTIEEYRSQLSDPITAAFAVEMQNEQGDDPTTAPGDVDETVGLAPRSPQSQTKAAPLSDYQILSELGRGGMGVVYKARQKSLNRLVALKMIRAGEFADEQDVERFHSEAQAAAKLDHSGIVQVHEVGQHDGQHFYSMAFVEGQSLSDRVKDDGPLLPRHAAEIIEQAAKALHHAHDNGIVHRDIKPHNILLDKDQRARITDFGLAKHLEGDSELTKTGQVMGTPSYMPPEQARGEAVNAESDVYSLGATLYFLLVGRPPHQAANPAETIRQVLDEDPAPLRRLNSAIPRDLETICHKCLRKEPGKRYGLAEELADDLQSWLDNKPIVARRVGLTEKAWLWCKRRPAIAALLVAFVVIGIATGLIVHERRNALYTAARVEAIVQADIDEAPVIALEMEAYRRWSELLVRDRLSSAIAKSDEQLKLRMALVRFDNGQVQPLFDELLARDTRYVGAIIESLRPYRKVVSESLWKVLHGKHKDSRRFNAGVALAAFAPHDGRWATEDHARLARQLVEDTSRNFGRHESLLRRLHSMRVALAKPLGLLARDEKLSELQRRVALNATVVYAKDQTGVLCDLLMDLEMPEFNEVFELIEAPNSSAVPILKAELAKSILEIQHDNALTTQKARTRLGQRQANAAIALSRLAEADSIWPMFARPEDRRAGSWFIERAADHLVDPLLLIARLDPSPNRTGEAVAVQQAVIQALQRYELQDELKEKAIRKILQIYKRHPDPGVHSSAAWLIGHLNRGESLRALDKEFVETEEQLIRRLGKGDGRRWYVNGQLQTMVMVGASEFQMGSQDDPDARKDERPHRRQLAGRYAIGATEVTRMEFAAHVQEKHRAAWIEWRQQWSKTDDSPALSVSWYDAVEYCNWLSERERIPKDQWCYEPTPDGGYSEGMRIKENVLALRGYRLATEAEWEHAAKAGAISPRAYGWSSQLLARYAWYEANSRNQSSPVRSLRPNRMGLFGVLGNVNEWTLDAYRQFPNPGANSVVRDSVYGAGEVRDRDTRVLRSSAFLAAPRHLRATVRENMIPSFRPYNIGFRLARSLARSPAASEPAD